MQEKCLRRVWILLKSLFFSLSFFFEIIFVSVIARFVFLLRLLPATITVRLAAHKYWRISLSTSSSSPRLRFQSRKCVFPPGEVMTKAKAFFLPFSLCYGGAKSFWREFFRKGDGCSLFSSIFYWRRSCFSFYLANPAFIEKRRAFYTSCPPAHRTGNRESITRNAQPSQQTDDVKKKRQINTLIIIKSS